MTRIAKPCTLFTTMTGSPGNHIRYLFDGHGMDGHEHALWTKGIPKAARELAKIDAYWDAVHDKWQEHTVAQAKMTGKQVFVALPNDIADEEIAKVAKAVLKTVPQHHPATMTVHYTSGKDGKPNVHLHGVISMRRGGYGKTNDEYRLNARELAKQAVDKTLKKCGYTIEQNTKTVKTRPHRFEVQRLRRQHTEEQLKSPEFLRCFVLPNETGRTKQWLKETIAKIEYQKYVDMLRFASDSAPFWNIRASSEPPTEKARLPAGADMRLKQKVITQPRPTDGVAKFEYLKQCAQNRISVEPVSVDAGILVHDVSKWGNVSAEIAGGTYGDNGTIATDEISKRLAEISKTAMRKQGMRK